MNDKDEEFFYPTLEYPFAIEDVVHAGDWLAQCLGESAIKDLLLLHTCPACGDDHLMAPFRIQGRSFRSCPNGNDWASQSIGKLAKFWGVEPETAYAFAIAVRLALTKLDENESLGSAMSLLKAHREFCRQDRMTGFVGDEPCPFTCREEG